MLLLVVGERATYAKLQFRRPKIYENFKLLLYVSNSEIHVFISKIHVSL